MIVGSVKHFSPEDVHDLKIALMSDEAVSSASIKGETLDRDGVQSSIQQILGLKTPGLRALPAERGFAKIIVDLYETAQAPLTRQQLFSWHDQLMQGCRDVVMVGDYRAGNEPIQIVSGAVHVL
jgi:Fic family protein